MVNLPFGTELGVAELFTLDQAARVPREQGKRGDIALFRESGVSICSSDDVGREDCYSQGKPVQTSPFSYSRVNSPSVDTCGIHSRRHSC